MAKKNFSLAVGLAVAFLAMQTPHLAQANGGGGGEREVINTTVFPERHRQRQTLRGAVPTENRAIKTEKTKTTESKGFFGRLFGKK